MLRFLILLKSLIVCSTDQIFFPLLQVACIDVTPLTEGASRSDIVAVGLWTDISVRLLKLPSLEEIAKEPLGGGLFLIKKLIAYVYILK